MDCRVMVSCLDMGVFLIAGVLMKGLVAGYLKVDLLSTNFVWYVG